LRKFTQRLIGAPQVSFTMDDTSELTPNMNTQAGNAFGGKQSAANKAKGSGE
jgi:hypothetical protein